MHAEKRFGNLNVSLELGKPGGKNPEHICNVQVILSCTVDLGLRSAPVQLARIRGISVYKKIRNGKTEWVLRYPGYKGMGSTTATAYLQFSAIVNDFIYETLETIQPHGYVARYSGSDNWTIWDSKSSKEKVQ